MFCGHPRMAAGFSLEGYVEAEASFLFPFLRYVRSVSFPPPGNFAKEPAVFSPFFLGTLRQNRSSRVAVLAFLAGTLCSSLRDEKPVLGFSGKMRFAALNGFLFARRPFPPRPELLSLVAIRRILCVLPCVGVWFRVERNRSLRFPSFRTGVVGWCRTVPRHLCRDPRALIALLKAFVNRLLAFYSGE